MERSHDNLDKDTKGNSLSLMDSSISLSYKKTNKLTTALYMVTDILDKDEPLRQKLRTLGIEVLSDITSAKGLAVTVTVTNKIQEILYFLDIAETLELISRMNSRVLKNEFFELQKSLQEYKDRVSSFRGKSTLSEFFQDPDQLSLVAREDNIDYPIGHLNQTRIGVQKGSNFMKALSDRISLSKEGMSFNQKNKRSPIENKYKNKTFGESAHQNFDLLKKERREEIIDIIQAEPNHTEEGVSITDIRSKAKGTLKSSSEKTLQRELVSMVKDNILKKTGDKRWSRYYVL